MPQAMADGRDVVLVEVELDVAFIAALARRVVTTAGSVMFVPLSAGTEEEVNVRAYAKLAGGLGDELSVEYR